MSRKMTTRLITMTLLIIICTAWINTHATKAELQQTLGEAACVCYAPKAWGDFKNGSPAAGVVFEDAAGNLRFVNSFPCQATPPIALEIRRTNPKSN